MKVLTTNECHAVGSGELTSLGKDLLVAAAGCAIFSYIAGYSTAYALTMFSVSLASGAAAAAVTNAVCDGTRVTLPSLYN